MPTDPVFDFTVHSSASATFNNPISNVVAHVSRSPVERMRTMGDGLQPVSQEQIDAIRSAITLEMIGLLRQIEHERDVDLSRANAIDAGLELTRSFRSNLDN